MEAGQALASELTVRKMCLLVTVDSVGHGEIHGADTANRTVRWWLTCLLLSLEMASRAFMNFLVSRNAARCATSVG